MMNNSRHGESFHGGSNLIVMFAFVIFAAICFGWQVGWRPYLTLSLRRPAGVTVQNAPNQVILNEVKSWKHKGSTITALATFTVEAIVAMNIPYSTSNDEFKLSPLDLVVIWGIYSDTSKLSKVSFSHGYRVVYMSDWALIPFLSHIHVIPADDTIKKELSNINTEDIIELKGYLVSVQMEGFLPWTSSLSRDDSKCEIMWIDSVKIQSRRPSLIDWISRRLSEIFKYTLAD